MYGNLYVGDKMKDKKKKNKGILNKILLVLMAICLVGASYFIYSYFADQKAQYANAEIALDKASTVIDKKTDYRKKAPDIGNVIGTIKIEGLTSEMPIIEGADLNLSLAHGVGHLEGTPLPGEKNQSVFSAHRETFFSSLKDLKKGDIVVVKMPYGTYKYKITRELIVGTDQASADKVYSTAGMKDERIALITCYPFEAWTSPNQRYVAYGDLIS